MAENERIVDDRPDKIGSPLDQKIDTKVSHNIFISTIGGVSIIALFIFGILFNQLSELNKRASELEKDAAVFKSRLDSTKQ